MSGEIDLSVLDGYWVEARPDGDQLVHVDRGDVGEPIDGPMLADLVALALEDGES